MQKDQYTQWCNQIHAPAQLVENTCAQLTQNCARPKPFARRFGPVLAACACVLALALCLPLLKLAAQPLPQAMQEEIPPASQGTIEKGIQIKTPLADGEIASKVELSNGVLYFSKEDDFFLDSARLYFGEGSTEERWDEERVRTYLGREFLPTVIPQGLLSQQGEEATHLVVYNAQGELVYDTFCYQWQDAKNPQEYIPDRAQLRVEVAKDKLPFQCGLYQFEEENRSAIGQTQVFTGFLMMDYGPYDPVTHEPSGEYPLFVAEFVYNGVGYHIEGHNVTQRQFIDTLLSVF